MSTDVRPKSDGHLETSGDPQRPSAQQQQRDGQGTSLWRWRRGLVAIGAIGLLAIAAALIPSTAPSQGTGPKLTHTIARGDLLVTVTEQGTLESSNNTEIKCKVRGFSTVTWVISGGTVVEQGDELVRLDTKVIEEQVSLTKTNTHIARATLARTKANVEKADIAIDAYQNGVYLSQLKLLEKGLKIAEWNRKTSQTMLDDSETLFKQGYITELEVQGNSFTVTQAELELKVKKTEIKVLKQFTKKMQLETFRGNLKASKSKLEADEAGLAMEEKRKAQAQVELAACIIKSPRTGLVIYPSAAAWKQTPDITEGATVRKDQIMLLMPDLTKMQVKVGIHESIVDRVRPGLKAIVTLSDRTIEAEVTTVASVTRPAGWWTGNVVKYDTIIELPAEEGLKPGMSAEVEVVMARHQDVLMIPVAAVMETDEGDFCWVKTVEQTQRRLLQLGDSNDVFIVVESGLKEGDKVILNPRSVIEEAQTKALKTHNETKPREPISKDSDTGSQSQKPGNRNGK